MSSLLQSIPLSDRPRERMIAYGPDAMTSVELLAIVLGTGTRTKSVLDLAYELLAHFGSVAALAGASIEEMCQISGMGTVKAVRLKAALSLAQRVSDPVAKGRTRIGTPEDVYRLLSPTLEAETRELFIVVLLDVKGGLIGHDIAAVGTLSNVMTHPREVFFQAVRRKAASIILVHNHPSGDPTPSREDIQITEALVRSGKTMGIPVRDHLIIGRGCYQSLKEEGVCFR